MRFNLINALTLICIFFISINQSLAFEEEIDKLSSKMAKKIVEKNKKKLAVVDFTDLQGNVTELGRFISEEMSVSLADSSEFSIVDRTHLKALIKEHKLSATGIINPQTARKLGKISGVEAIITGTLTAFGENVRISVKVLDTETADIVSSVRGNIAKTKGIEELLSTDISTLSSSIKRPSKVNDKFKNTNASSNMISNVEGFEFMLKKCAATGSILECDLQITNMKQDRLLQLHGTYADKTRVFNSFGDEFNSTKVQLGNSYGTDYTVQKTIPNGIPIKASVTYKINNKTNFLNLLELGIEVSRTRALVQFKNIAIQR